MTLIVTVPLLAAALLGAGWSALASARGTSVSNRLLIVLVALEVLTVVQLVAALVFVLVGKHPDSTATYLLYAVVEPLVAPVAVFWSAAEKSRPSILVITVGCVAVGVMTLRMVQMWSDVHG